MAATIIVRQYDASLEELRLGYDGSTARHVVSQVALNNFALTKY